MAGIQRREINARNGAGKSIRKSLLRCFAFFLISASMGAQASNSADGLRLSGFGTLGYAADDRADIAAARDISQQPQNGFATGDTWRIDSRLGVQLEYGVNDNIDLVGQVVARDQFVDSFDHSVELAYLTIKPRANLDIRFGRVNYDAFLMSDHRNVGYAYSPVRPPTEFYGWIPIFSFDGGDAAYAIQSGDVRWRIKAQAGSSDIALPIGAGYDFKAKDLLGLSLAMQSERWRLKAAYSQFTSAVEVPAFAPLHQGLDQIIAAGIPAISAEAADLRRNLTFKGAKVTYATIGIVFDDGVWLGQAELGHTTASAAAIPHGSMGYLMFGRRFSDLMPYAMLSKSKPGNDLRSADNNWGGFNAVLRDPAILTINDTRIEQSSVSLGARWDLHPQAAFKLQWDQTTIKPSGYGLWWRVRAINLQTTRVNLVSATLDFVF